MITMISLALTTLPLWSLVASQTITITEAPSIPSEAPEFVNHAAFTSAILNRTNFYRGEHDASDVRWNQTLEKFASDYLDSTCEFEHSGGPYGENLAIGCSNATSCVEAWGNERDMYDFDNPRFTQETGHFSQLVWNDTTDVGVSIEPSVAASTDHLQCGRRLCGEHGWYLACEYWPRGNVEGAYAEDVGDPAGGSKGLQISWPTMVFALVSCFARLW